MSSQITILFLIFKYSLSHIEKLPKKPFIIAKQELKECILHFSLIILYNDLLMIPLFFISIELIYFVIDKFIDISIELLTFNELFFIFNFFIDLYGHKKAASS